METTLWNALSRNGSSHYDINICQFAKVITKKSRERKMADDVRDLYRNCYRKLSKHADSSIAKNSEFAQLSRADYSCARTVAFV